MRIRIEFYKPDSLEFSLDEEQERAYLRFMEAGGLMWTAEWRRFWDSIEDDVSYHLVDSRSIDSVDEA